MCDVGIDPPFEVLRLPLDPLHERVFVDDDGDLRVPATRDLTG
jgi:hypothetical protein